jgi:D-lactate dehydrogenase (cytochrome)
MRDAPWVIQARPPRGAAGAIRRLRAADDVEPFLHDAAHYPNGRTPEVCFPESEADVAALLGEARHVLVVGAQSSLTGGATPFGETLVSTARMDGIVAWHADGVTVGPGMVLRVLEAELRRRDLYYPPMPTYDGATVGGTVATNAAGAATFKYGTTRAWIRGLTVVLADGTVLDLRRGEGTASPDGHFTIVGAGGVRRRVALPSYRTPDLPKVSAGYWARPGMDLLDLFVGSEGTLGIVTAVELRLLARRPAWLVGLVPLADEVAALRLVAALRGASGATWRTRDVRGLEVAAVEYLDRRCLELIREDGVAARLGVPLSADAGVAILFQVELAPGTSSDVAADEMARVADPAYDTPVGRLCRLLREHGVLDATLPALPDDVARRDALFALREAAPEAVNRRVAERQRTIDPTISKSGGDVIVPFERLGEALAAYRTALVRRGLDHAIWGHVSDGNVHPNVLPRSADEMRRAREAQLEIGQIAIDLGGAPMSEHGTGRNPVKQELLECMVGSDGLAAMRALKHALDPRDVLAPGVIFGPTA